VADLDLRAATRAAEDHPALAVKAVTREFGQTGADIVRWADVAKAGDDHILTAWPTANIPQTPAAKRQWLSELLADGVITIEDYADQLDVPLVDRAVRLRAAPRRLIEQALERICETRVYDPPEPYYPLAECVAVGRAWYALAKTQLPREAESEDSREILDLVRRWIDDAKAMEDDTLAAAQPAPGAPTMPMPPGAPPMPEGMS
jgi:hypothetical protein